ncbi:hypothetical protein [Salibaculum griseiflavum]|nr:hypothetical protein [Salibaculum griseiflavum]
MYDFQNTLPFEWERHSIKEDSIEYDLCAMPDVHPKFEQFVSHIYEYAELDVLINAKKSEKTISYAKNKILVALKSILWHFYRVAAINQDCFIKISFSANSYKAKSNSNPFNISRKIIDVIRKLEEKNLVEIKIGYLDRSKNISKRTRIRPSVLLLEKLQNLPSDIHGQYVKPTVLKFCDKGKKLTPLNEWNKDHPEVSDAYNLLERYNQFMNEQVIEIDGVTGHFAYWRDRSRNLRTIDLTKIFLWSVIHRYTDEDLRYFRMHGAFWQSMPSVYRKLIRINGEKTVCFDYTAQVLNIIASEHDIQIPSDPYKINLDRPALSPEMERKVIKTAVTIFVNADNMKSARHAIRNKLIESVLPSKYPIRITNEFLDQVHQRILRSYPFLEEHIMDGQGTLLFKKDAEIARHLIEMALDENKVILPIHDGFIMQEGDKEFLREAMKDVWSQNYSTTIAIKSE